MAVAAVTREGMSIAVACRTFGLSETCYRYTRKHDEENQRIAALLIGLTQSRRTWGFGLCFLHLRNVQGHTGKVFRPRLERSDDFAQLIWFGHILGIIDGDENAVDLLQSIVERSGFCLRLAGWHHDNFEMCWYLRVMQRGLRCRVCLFQNNENLQFALGIVQSREGRDQIARYCCLAKQRHQNGVSWQVIGRELRRWHVRVRLGGTGGFNDPTMPKGEDTQYGQAEERQA